MMWGAGGWWWGWIMMASIWLGIVLLVVWVVRGSDRRDPSEPTEAERRLDERFASGEIDSEEYESRRAVLRHRS